MKLDHMVILLSSLESGMDFYHTLLPMLGFNQSRPSVYLNDEGFALDFRQAADTEHEYRRYAAGLNHMGFTAKNLTEIKQIADNMMAAGFEVADIQTFPEGKALFLKDEDGMRVEISTYEA